MVQCWGITGGSAGMAAQALAMADMLGLSMQMKNIQIRKPWVWLPNYCYTKGLDRLVMPYAIERGSESLDAPWPDLVISCGRRGAIAALGLKAHLRHKGWKQTRFIHIQDPHIDPRYFDLVVAMEHDKITGPNVLKTRFALHRITAHSLAAAEVRFSTWFSDYPRPQLAVLIGGSTNKYTLTQERMRVVIDELQRIVYKTPCSLLITPSRRTGADNIALLHQMFDPEPRVYIYDFDGENPYMGMLALADGVMVTNDSVNMMTDAHATGKPLYLLNLPDHHNTKPSRFAQKLLDDGIARIFENQLEFWQYRTNNEMDKLAADIKRVMKL
ncbi:MAG: mitochondrial fission ELM1 family protein [Rickettsiales bacterium]|nr:mitochondrial fission ELM1 family protein [Rickettsiales bacterium]